MDQLKEVILSTLEEIQESIPPQEEEKESLHVNSQKEIIEPFQTVSSEKEESKTLTKDNFFNEVTSQKSTDSNES
ncbi:MAG: hypothetical protein GXO11_08470, partial [Epsilonproteobacteria bacterium]|nr:hypothetical protein [Campylobacterota bacterium]